MNKRFTLAIPTPCPENWDGFTPTQKGRFCGSCQKEVIDFTTWSEEQIKEYFQKLPANTCGRFATHQLTSYQLHTPTPPLPKQRSTWAAALAFIILLFGRPAEAQSSKAEVRQEQIYKDNTALSHTTDSVKQLVIKGVVQGESAEDIMPGINVLRKGFAQGTVTDGDGHFELVIDNPKSVETLVFSFIGYVTIEHQVDVKAPTKEIKISMNLDVAPLGDIVIIAGGVVATRWYSPRGIWWRVKSIFRR